MDNGVAQESKSLGNLWVDSSKSTRIVGCKPLFELASFGPIARSIEDLELVLPIISEPGTPPLTPLARRALSELRVAWTDDFGGTPLDGDSRHLASPVVVGILERTAKMAGGCVEPPMPDAVRHCWQSSKRQPR